MTTTTPGRYAITNGQPEIPVETWPTTLEGITTAICRASHFSLRHGPHEVRRPDGTVLARYARGKRADLPPAGIIRSLAERTRRGQQ